MTLSRIIIIGLMSTIAGLAVLQITTSNMLSTDGIDLGNMQSRLAQLKKENTLLREKIYTVGSLTHVASVAAGLGFVPEKSAEFIPTTQEVALK